MSERPQRCGRRKDIIPAGGFITARLLIKAFVGRQMVVISRQMPYALGKGENQFSRRIHFPEKNIGYGVARLFSCIPLCKNGWNMFFFPGDTKGFAGYKYQHYRFSCFVDRTDKLALRSRQLKVVQVKAFSTVHLVIITRQRCTGTAAEEQGYITSRSNLHRFGNSRSIFGHHTASTGITDGSLVAHQPLYPFQRGDAILIVPAPCVITELHLCGIRPDDCNRTNPVEIQRQ